MSHKDPIRSKKPPLQLAFVWHMHQPDYRDRDRKRFEMPWVRLHALKDYYDMPARLGRYPGIHQTFNLVPSLIEQIEDYLSGEWTEVELDFFFKPADTLADGEKEAILTHFFNGPEEFLVRPYPRYNELLRDYRSKPKSGAIRSWSASKWRDLQFWRQLAWTDPFIREKDPFLNGLIAQGQDFREDQKEPLWQRMRHWLSESIEIYMRLREEGSVEVTITPYYHPILPLLIDPHSAHESMPGCPLPEPFGLHPEDALYQMEAALAFYEKRFGARPRGVWPSEGSVSQETARLLSDLGVEWFATDEDILARSLGRPVRGGPGDGASALPDLYRPYRTLSGKGPVAVFRDHRLSDLIGFEYQRWAPEEAARDFVVRLLRIHKGWEEEEPPLVSIVLDGENCWEYYPEDGGPFLDALYARLSETPQVQCVTVSEALAHCAAIPLQNLSAGSWINGNFYIWIGEEEDRRAWGLLEKTRRALVAAEKNEEASPAKLREAWEDIYAAQGSDWYWWFGDTHSTAQMALFDELFRKHLIRVYTLLDLEVPSELYSRIASAESLAEALPEPIFQVPPILDGKESHYYEWKAAAVFDPLREGGAMRAAEASGLEKVWYGCDDSAFYLRLDPAEETKNARSWELRIHSPSLLQFRFTREGNGVKATRRRIGDSSENDNGEIELSGSEEVSHAVDRVLEVRLGWDILETDGAKTLSFTVGVETADGKVDRIPAHSHLGITLPQGDRPSRYWFP